MKKTTLLSIFLAIFFLFIIYLFFQLYKVDLKIPFTYTGDGLFYGYIIKSILDNGNYNFNPFMGSPFGAYLYDFPVITELLYVIFIKILALFYNNYAEVLNIFYIASFFTVYLVSFWVLRSLDINIYLCSLGAILYSFLPYHFQRLPHLFLASYFVVPVTIYLALIILMNKNFFYKKEKVYSSFVIFLAILTGSCGVYYSFFGAFLIMISGILTSLSLRAWKPTINAGIIISIISTTSSLILIPNIIHKLQNTPNSVVSQRHPAESEIYGLRMTQLVLPLATHRIDWLTEKTKNYNKSSPVINENTMTTLGLIGSIGFIFLLISIFIKDQILYRIQIIPQLAKLNLACFLLGTIGGLGSLFALFISPLIRGYNRISVFIAFLSITAILLILQKAVEYRRFKNPNLVYLITSILILPIGLFDQTSPIFVPNYAAISQEYQNDAQFVQEIESSVPPNTMIYQLPYVEYPEHPPAYKEGSYGLMRGYLHSKNLKWSYGAMKNRGGSRWLNAISTLPIKEQIQKIADSGFGGIYIDRRGFKDHAIQLENQLKSLVLTDPIISENSNLAFYRIKPTGNIPVIVLPIPILANGFYGWEGGLGKFAWTSGNAELLLINPYQIFINGKLLFKLNTLLRRNIIINFNTDSIVKADLKPGQPQTVEIDINLEPGETRLQLQTDTSAQQPGNGDTRELAFSITDVILKINK